LSPGSARLRPTASRGCASLDYRFIEMLLRLDRRSGATQPLQLFNSKYSNNLPLPLHDDANPRVDAVEMMRRSEGPASRPPVVRPI